MTKSHLSIVDDIPETPAELDTSSQPVNDMQPGEQTGACPDDIVVPQPPRIPLALLAPHPDNKREDLDLNDGFIASIREEGINDPIEVVPLADDMEPEPADAEDPERPRPRFRIVNGHRRYFGGLKAEVEDAPVFLSRSHADDQASQYLTMFTTSRHSAKLSPIEEASALFSAHQAGASHTVIRRKTGLGRDEVKSTLKAGGLSQETKAKVQDGYDLDIEQYALLTEFEDDETAVDAILRDIQFGGSGKHAAERIRQSRVLKAEADQARERYATDGFEVADMLPGGARYLNMLLQDGEDITAEMHASCPGRGVVVHDDDPEGSPYCSAPEAHGHVYRFAAPDSKPPQDKDPAQGNDDPSGDDNAPEPSPEAPGHRLVREGNVAWAAAGKVRRQWLKSLCARVTIPREAQLFAAKQILTMPPNVAGKLGGARNEELFQELTSWADADRLAGWKPGKLPVVQFALVITAYEVLLTSNNGKLCWRPAAELRFPPVDREDAGVYFAQLAALGYRLSTIEQAMADNVPYEGEPALDEPDTPPADA